MSASKRSWLAAASIGFLPWLGSAVSKHYEAVLNQTGSQSALRMMPIGWLIAGLGGFLVAYLMLGPGSQKLPAVVLTAASLLGAVSTWRFIYQRNLSFLDAMPPSWQAFTILEPIAVHMVFGFALGWLWKATR